MVEGLVQLAGHRPHQQFEGRIRRLVGVAVRLPLLDHVGDLPGEFAIGDLQTELGRLDLHAGTSDMLLISIRMSLPTSSGWVC